MKIPREIRLRVKMFNARTFGSGKIALDQKSIKELEIGPENLVEIGDKESKIVSIDRGLTSQVPVGYALIPMFTLYRRLNLRDGDEILIRKFEQPKELHLRVFPSKHRSRLYSHVVLNKQDFKSLSLGNLDPVELIRSNSIIAPADVDVFDDPDPGTILIDGSLRRTLGVQLNDYVTLRKTNLEDAIYIEIALENASIWHRPSLESWIKEQLHHYQIITAGDKIFLPFDRIFSENPDGITVLVKRTIPEKSCKIGFHTQTKLVGNDGNVISFYPTYPLHMTILCECERILQELSYIGKSKKMHVAKGGTENIALSNDEYLENPLDQLSGNVKLWLEKLIENGVKVEK